jgi:hypothetical protein
MGVNIAHVGYNISIDVWNNTLKKRILYYTYILLALISIFFLLYFFFFNTPKSLREVAP